MEDKSLHANKVLEQLLKHYPEARCELSFKNPYELLVATILSARCTDKAVNKVTPTLFSKYPTPQAMASGDIEDIKKIIHSTGFYNNKAKSIQNASITIERDFNGDVPNNMADLIKLPGVARKTANVVLWSGFQKNEGIAVDTHVKRISNLIGLSDESDPVKIERDLMEVFPEDKWGYVSLSIVQYGRHICTAKKHDQEKCFLGGHVD